MMVHRWLCVVTALVGAMIGAAGSLNAQDLRHPKDMGLQAVQVRLPDTSRNRLVLENGLVGFVVSDRTVPLVRFTAFVRGGSADDRTQGAAEMLELMMKTSGPCWMRPGRFQETLEELDAEFSVVLGPEMTEISMQVAPEDARAALRVFSGIIREPCMTEEGLEVFRDRVNGSAVHTGRLDPSLDMAMQVFEDELFKGHEYRRSVTVSDASALRVEDVERYHRDFYTPSNVVLAVSGWFDVLPMAQELDQRFADWRYRRPPRFDRGERISTPEPRVTTAIEVDKLQTWIVIGHELPAMEPRNFAALEVMNYILGGGHFDTRLFREARDRRGLTNDASGYLMPALRGPGTYTFRTSSRPDVTDELITLVFSEIDRIRTQPVTEEELSVAKAALVDGVFPMRFENGHSTARTFALEWARYVTFDHLARYRDWVRDVSVRDVQRAAERYLHPERMRIVLVGPNALSEHPE